MVKKVFGVSYLMFTLRVRNFDFRLSLISSRVYRTYEIRCYTALHEPEKINVRIFAQSILLWFMGFVTDTTISKGSIYTDLTFSTFLKTSVKFNGKFHFNVKPYCNEIYNWILEFEFLNSGTWFPTGERQQSHLYHILGWALFHSKSCEVGTRMMDRVLLVDWRLWKSRWNITRNLFSV